MDKEKNIRTAGMKTNALNDGGSLPVRETPTNIPASDVFTSYIFSTSSRSLSKYGERLLMEVISTAQEYTIDTALGIHRLDFGEKYKEKFAIIDIPVKNLLNADDTTNYTKAKEAAVELMKIYHTVEAPVLNEDGTQKTFKDGSPQYQFASFHLLDRVTVNQKPGIVSVKLGEETWSQILDMGKGYTRYNLLTAKSLDDVVAIRLFQIMSNSSEPIRFSLERLKGILGLQDKYVGNPTGFIRRVIDPAEQEIREKCPFELVHDLEYEQVSRKGRPSIVGIVFRKVPRQTIIMDPAAVLGQDLCNVLKKKYGFDDRGIRSNMRLFSALVEAGHDIVSHLDKIWDYAKEAVKPQAYVIKSLQNLLGGTEKPSGPVVASPHVPEAAAAGQRKARTARASSRKKDGGRLDVSGADAFAGSGLEEL